MFDFSLLLDIEGGYVNDPNDSGGETKYGISKKAYPSVDIKNLTRETAIEIYKRDYYLKYKIDQVKNPDIAQALLIAVVHGGGGMYAYLEAEFQTKNLVQLLNTHTDDSKIRLAITHRYISLCNKNPNLKRYFFAWVERRIYYEW